MNIDIESSHTLYGFVGTPHKVQAFIPSKCGSLALKVFGLRAQTFASLREPMHDAAEYNRCFNVV